MFTVHRTTTQLYLIDTYFKCHSIINYKVLFDLRFRFVCVWVSNLVTLIQVTLTGPIDLKLGTLYVFWMTIGDILTKYWDIYVSVMKALFFLLLSPFSFFIFQNIFQQKVFKVFDLPLLWRADL